MTYSLEQLQAGELLLIDKPLEWTSFDVVNKIRAAIRYGHSVKKFKVGHAGTLDPLATGLLLICTGKNTRKIEQLQGLDKVYTGTLHLGASTPSYDLETEIDERFPVDKLTSAELEEAAKKLNGEQLQYPPAFSAKRVNGKRAYEMARKGKKVKMNPHSVWIHRFEITRIELPEVDFFVHCSKGTYIRSLVRDFARLLDNGAHLTALRRERIGSFNIEDALSLDDLVPKLRPDMAK